MGFYDGMAETAAKLIGKFGADVVFQSTSAGTFDPVIGETVGAITNETTTKGIQKRYSAALIDDTRIKSGDKLFVVDDSYKPLMSDKIKISTEYWNIINIEEVTPAGVSLVYFVQVRK